LIQRRSEEKALLDSSKSGSLATNLKDSLCVTAGLSSTRTIVQLFLGQPQHKLSYILAKAANATAQIHLRRAKYYTLAYDRAVTTFGGYHAVVLQCFMGSVHRSTKLF
jgi:hypothetical protein